MAFGRLKSEVEGQSSDRAVRELEKPRSIELALSEAYKGGVVPVALMYDQAGDDGSKRPLRDTEQEQGSAVSAGSTEVGHKEMQSQAKNHTENINHNNNGSNIKNSKLLNIEARESDDNANFGLGIQSRNNPPAEDKETFEKPFVYNIQPLSFYSSETKEEENILNYINRIKEMKENQIKLEASKKQENKPSNKNEESVITESHEVDNRPIRRKIQHYQTVIKPILMEPQGYGGALPQGAFPVYPANTMGMYQNPYSQQIPNFYQTPQQPSIIYLPNPFQLKDSGSPVSKNGHTRIFDDYFPILINNPFNEIWAGITNIIEYGPEADVCRRNKKGREADEEVTTEIDIPSGRIGLIGFKGDSWPKFARLKVRKGGVAIAGPGGIATAGSGGTAIVGPGGTAYTTREGTAVVGPGGRVVHVPEFPIYAKDIDGTAPQEFEPPLGSRTVAEGPVVYYDNPLDQYDVQDPTALV
ncbi:hypothetical protein J6590_004020 [Homalodisca vitripennis]|nr:hypothetical protein J6590_004020 [Homalodisca vitripennis]